MDGFSTSFILLLLFTLLSPLSSYGASASSTPTSFSTSSFSQTEALLQFKAQIQQDSNGVLSSWDQTLNPNFCQNWTGITCNSEGYIITLSLSGKSLFSSNLEFSWLQGIPYLQTLDLSINSLSGNLSSLQALNLATVNLSRNAIAGELPSSLFQNCSFSLLSVDLSENAIGGTLPSSIQCVSLLHLNLAGNRLSGSIPPWMLQNSTSVVSLDLSRNNISGTIPDQLFYTCAAMETLDLSSNQVLGTIPASLQNCRNLSLLNLTSNLLSSELPEYAIANLTSIQTLHLANNMLHGLLPSSAFATVCRTLQDLDLSGNNITGSLPLSMASCKTLKSLKLARNSLTGNFPASVVSQLTSIETLRFTFNKFTGPVPAMVVQNCQKLRILDIGGNSLAGTISEQTCSDRRNSMIEELLLPNNQLTGTIPPSLMNCTRLVILDLSFNRLTGSVPPELGFLQNLESLSLWYNRLTGPIPAELGNLPKLRNLNLNNNQLTGHIPSELAKCKTLEWVNLNNNQLTGQIPSELGLLQSLTLLQLANNSLSGAIPAELGNCSQLLWVDLNTNKLTGPIPKALGRHSEFPLSKPVLVGDQLGYVRNAPSSCKGSGMGIMLDFTGIDPESLSTTLFTNMNCPENPTVYIGGSLYDNPENRTIQYLDLSFNQLSGTIPEEMGTWVSLISLALSHNQLTGALPKSLGKLRVLGVMDISYNQLQGSLSVLADCSLLVSVDVSNNFFSGPIPVGQLSTNPIQSFVNNSGLCGQPLAPCSNNSSLEGANLPCSGSGSGRECSKKSKLNLLSFANSIVLAILVTLLCICAFFVWVGFIIKNRTKKMENSLLTSLQQSSCNGTSSSWNLSGEKEPLSINVATFERPLRKLTFSQLIEATNGFSKESLVGTGGFGEVYRAELKDGTVVAIKKLLQFSFQGDREFMAEMETLGKIKHRNLVPLLGYCKVGEERLLVYEYMQGGSLDEVLHGSPEGREKLSWDCRKQIAKGAARGLAFLHHNCIPHIIHRDMKSSNVLLDKDLEARVSDFGMARLISALDTHLSVSTLAGTPGYVPPEYYQSFRCTTKGDIYSFGVILLELVTGKCPTDKDEFGDNNLVGWVKLHVASNNSLEVLDPLLRGTGAEHEMIQYLKIACQCLDDHPTRRPTMLRVIAMLKELALEDQSSSNLQISTSTQTP